MTKPQLDLFGAPTPKAREAESPAAPHAPAKPERHLDNQIAAHYRAGLYFPGIGPLIPLSRALADDPKRWREHMLRRREAQAERRNACPSRPTPA